MENSTENISLFMYFNSLRNVMLFTEHKIQTKYKSQRQRAVVKK